MAVCLSCTHVTCIALFRIRPENIMFLQVTMIDQILTVTELANEVKVSKSGVVFSVLVGYF